MAEDTENISITVKKDYVKDHIYWASIVLFIQIGLITALGFFIFYQIQSFPKPIFFPANEREQIIESTSLEQPGMSDAAVLNWVVEAIRVSYSFNYRSINNHINKIYTYFDKRGMSKFFQVISADTNMKQVKPDQLIVSIKAKEAPKIIKEGKIDDRHVWLVNFPVEIRYENVAILRRQTIDIDLYVWRVPDTESPFGIKITNFKVTVKKSFEPQPIMQGNLQ